MIVLAAIIIVPLLIAAFFMDHPSWRRRYIRSTSDRISGAFKRLPLP